MHAVNDPVYSNEFKASIKKMGIKDKPTTPYSPWQNPYVERANGSICRDCLDHVIVLNEKHLYKIMAEYVEYYNNARCHESLDGNSPMPREKDIAKGKILSEEYLGGLHHRYFRKAS